MAGATARDRAVVENVEGGGKEEFIWRKETVKVQSNSTGKLKSESITDDGSAVLRRNFVFVRSRRGQEGSYKKINDDLLEKLVKKFLNGQTPVSERPRLVQPNFVICFYILNFRH